jgi:nucleotide-binding universal stress UspA family protein
VPPCRAAILFRMPSGRIVLGVDGSPGARAAIRWCAAHAPALDAEVVVVHVVVPVLAGSLPQPVVATSVTEAELAAAAEDVEAWCEPLRSAGVTHEPRVVHGVPAGTLMQVADDVDALMIVVGRRGESGIADLVLGSVPRTLTHQCDRPVLVVPQ